MSYFLGIDTSNYTTSLALYNCSNNIIVQSKKLLPVKEGQLGLRQSDAVFHHTQQLPDLLEKLVCGIDTSQIVGIGVSSRPRNVQGSYMPCFTTGYSLARSIANILNVKLYETSHQVGHILAALYSADKMEFVNEKFIAFHISGGTTDCLLVNPSEESLLKITELGSSLDLKAGQAVDRTGLMLGLKFPCGKELERLAVNSDKHYKIKPVIRDNNCCLSGVENQCKAMRENGEKPEDIAKYCLSYIYYTVKKMTETALSNNGELPVVFAGGVMSNKYIRNKITKDFNNVYFAEPDFSCDNASGIALYAFLRSKDE